MARSLNSYLGHWSSDHITTWPRNDRTYCLPTKFQLCCGSPFLDISPFCFLPFKMISMSLYTKVCNFIRDFTRHLYFSHCCDKISDKSILKKDSLGSVRGPSPSRQGKQGSSVRWLVSHMLSAGRKLSDDPWCPACFLFHPVLDLTCRMDHPHSGWVFPPQLNLCENILTDLSKLLFPK